MEFFWTDGGSPSIGTGNPEGVLVQWLIDNLSVRAALLRNSGVLATASRQQA